MKYLADTQYDGTVERMIATILDYHIIRGVEPDMDKLVELLSEAIRTRRIVPKHEMDARLIASGCIDPSKAQQNYKILLLDTNELL